MKFALVDGERREAQPHLQGECVGCGSEMIPKCGEVKVHHWAHRGRRRCDPWWENETEWHRRWKGRFPDEWQEVVHHAEDGERHVADVKTDHGWVLEFQHSYIKPAERRSREAFYPRLMWVVDGTRRKRDEAQFLRTIEESRPIAKSSPIRRVWSEEGALLRDWVLNRANVFFDFGDLQGVWWLMPIREPTWAYVMPLRLSEFIGRHLRSGSDEACEFDRIAKELAGALSALHSETSRAQGRGRRSLLDPRRSPRRGRRL